MISKGPDGTGTSPTKGRFSQHTFELPKEHPQGRANTARGAAHFLRETVSRVRYAGARWMSGFPITIRQRASLRHLMEAIPDEDWTPIPYWMEGAAAVAETTYTPFQSESDAAPVQLIVRRVRPTPGSQLALFATYSYHAFITVRDGETLELEAGSSPPRRDRECHPRPQVRRRAEPSSPRAASPPTPPGWPPQVMAHNLARWTARLGLGEQIVTTKTLRRRVLRLGRAAHPLGTPVDSASSPALALGGSSSAAPSPGCKRFHSQPDDPSATDPSTGQPNVPANSRPLRSASVSCCVLSPPSCPAQRPQTSNRGPVRRLKTLRATSHLPQWSPGHLPCSSLTPFRCSHAVHSVSIGGFGLRRVDIQPTPGCVPRETAEIAAPVIPSVRRSCWRHRKQVCRYHPSVFTPALTILP